MRPTILTCCLLLLNLFVTAQDPARFIYRNREAVSFKFPTGNRNVELYYANVTDKFEQDSVELSFFEPGTMMLAIQYGDTSSKIIFQVGDKHTNTFKKRTSLLIDIIPEENPYGIRDGEKLKVKVLRDGEPLVNTAVVLTHYNNDKVVERGLSTNDKGETEFPVFIYGRWVLNAGAGSLVWGYIR